MDRRGFLKQLLSLSSVFSASAFAKYFKPTRIRGDEFFLVFEGTSVGQSKAQLLIKSIKKQLSTSHPQWKQSLTTLNSYHHNREIKELLNQYGPQTQQLTYPILVRIPHKRNENEVELWNLPLVRFRETNSDTIRYPISGSWWSVEGDWNPTIRKCQRHLYYSPNHDNLFSMEWLKKLQYAEIQSVHSDHHREMTDQAMVHWEYVNKKENRS